MLKLAHPSATEGHTLLLWCREDHDGGWSFDVASPFLLISKPHEEWMILEPPEHWINSPFEGLFVSARCSSSTRIPGDGARDYAERVGGSPEWGEVYKIGGSAVPGGNHANTSVLVLLAWHRPEGDWRILWSGSEAPFWSMGSYGVSDLTDFSVRSNPLREGALPFILTATLRYTKWPSFELDDNTHLIMNFARKARLQGAPSLKLEATTPWLHRLERPESWEQIARRIASYDHGSEEYIQRLMQRLKRSNPAIKGDLLEPGVEIVVSDSELP